MRLSSSAGHDIQAKTPEEAVQKYLDACPHGVEKEDTAERLLRTFQELTPEQRQRMLFGLCDATLPDIYTFSSEEILRLYPTDVQQAALELVLTTWSMSFGDLANEQIEHIFLGNPIWTKPFIRLPSGDFFIPLPGLCFAFCIDIMESLIESNEQLRKRYHQRRGPFLEEEAERVLKLAFPEAMVCRGSNWIAPDGTPYENDLLARVDCYLIVIEAKAGRVSDSTRRGAQLSLASTLENLVVAPAKQSKRFADFLLQNPAVYHFPTRNGGSNEVDSRGVHDVIRISVTLDLFGVLDAPSVGLREAGLVPQDADLAPTISVTDLETLCYVLETPGDRLHYLLRRNQFERNAQYIGDEIDLLAYYLDTGFNIGETEFDGTSLELWGMSQLLDPYFTSSPGPNRPPKPRRRMTPWWRDIINQVQARKLTRWSQITNVLLNFSYEDQKAFESQLKIAQKIAKIHWWKKGHTNTVALSVGPPQRKDAVVGLAYRGTKVTREKRNGWMDRGAKVAMVETPCDFAVVIGIDIDRNDYPYSVLHCLERYASIEEGSDA